MKPAFLKLLAVGGGVAAMTTAVWLNFDGSGSPAAPSSVGGGEHVSMLEPLGQAYATDYKLTFEKLDTHIAARVDGSNLAEWAVKVKAALSVGYAPKAEEFHALPFDRFYGAANIRMAEERTPSEVVELLLTPGVTVVESMWEFRGARPVRSYTIFKPDGRPVFDTLMSMPVIEGPLLDPGHL
jgi:hypothetical protein